MLLQPTSIKGAAGAVLLTICALQSLLAADGPLTGQNVLCFDLGPIGSAVPDRAVELNPDSMYSPQVGFGWMQRPQHGFDHPDLQKSRTRLTIDGVSGKHVVFHADVAPGNWHLTLWLETKEIDLRSPQIRIQGQQH